MQSLAAHTATWHTDSNTFDGPNEAPPIPDAVAAAIGPVAGGCVAPCLSLWTVDAITSRGRAAVWQVARTWVTPDTTNLCNSQVQGEFAIVVARGSAAVSLALHPGDPGKAGSEADDVFDPDVFAALEDDGGVRVLVTSQLGEYATWELSELRRTRRVHYGFPNEEEFGGGHQLGPYCGP
jgi:hypothetical protein